MIDINLIKSILKGMFTFIPGVLFLKNIKAKKLNHSCSKAEFCYNLWLSILIYIDEKKIKPKLNVIGEFGNGGSLGIGLCALLTGTEEYYSIDIDNQFDIDANLEILDNLLILFKQKTAISKKYSNINICLNNYYYPEELIEKKYLNGEFINKLKKEIKNINNKGNSIIKIWDNNKAKKLDFTFSRAVMEHVVNPEVIYKFIFQNSYNQSYTFHDIEFHSHNITKSINGHYFINKFWWKIIFGKRIYFLNRWMLKDHIKSLNANKFSIISLDVNKINNKDDDTDYNLYGVSLLAQIIVK